MSRAAAHTQAEIQRFVRAVRAEVGDDRLALVEITPSGALRALLGPPGSVPASTGEGGTDDGWSDVAA